MRHILAVTVVLGLMLMGTGIPRATAQDFGINGALEIKQIAPTPMAVRDLTATYTGAVGSATRYYWISTVYPNGVFVYCNDCTIASPCAAGGTCALAKRLAGAWVCN